jgi:predicted DCC family thiol-disulfide oxidoreductase YuxK
LSNGIMRLVANLFSVPCGAVGRRLGVWVRPTRRVAVLYDGGCGLCSTTIATLRRLDLLGTMAVFDVVAEWNVIELHFPGLDRIACLTDMHVVVNDGTVATGFDGYRELAKVLPLGWLTLPFLYLPGVPTICRRVYRIVADRRGGSSCVVPPLNPRP